MQNRFGPMYNSRESEVDRISELPDSLLQHILSFVSARYAIRTSILSRRWQNLWKLVPCIDLSPEQFSDENDLYSFMERFRNSHLQKFKVIYHIIEGRCSRFKAWIDTVVKCKVEYLDIESYHDWLDEHLFNSDGFEMPRSLWICNTLVILKLDGVDIFDVPEKVSLSHLKIMHFNNVCYANDIAFVNLISGCPVLEELWLIRGCEDNLNILCISSRTLKHLVIDSSFGGMDYGVVIDAPNLECLNLSDYGSKNFMITNISSSSLSACLNVRFGEDFLDELKVDDYSVRNSICRLFTGISNAKSLVIHLSTFKLLCQYRKFEALPQFHNLIYLKVKLKKPACKGLPAILELCPNLKDLVLKLYDAPESNPLRLSPVAPQCMLSSLESITLQKPIIGDATEMDLIKYFLENSALLKQMKVYLSKHLEREKELLILKELMMFRRSCLVYVERPVDKISKF